MSYVARFQVLQKFTQAHGPSIPVEQGEDNTLYVLGKELLGVEKKRAGEKVTYVLSRGTDTPMEQYTHLLVTVTFPIQTVTYLFTSDANDSSIGAYTMLGASIFTSLN